MGYAQEVKMKLLCFDLDNTLVKATKAHLHAYKLAFKQLKLPKKTNKEIFEYLSLASSEFIKKLYPKLNEKQIKEIVVLHNKYFSKKTIQEIKLIKGTKRTLMLLCPKYKIAILSNATSKHIEETLKQVGIHKQLFDLIIGSDKIKHHKPHPEGILKAKKILKCNDGYMIGDAIFDVQAGKAAKFKTISVLTGTDSKSKLKKENPNFILKSVKDLPKILP
jgi:HAD superfamily hydrolase (TIGR01549 family)